MTYPISREAIGRALGMAIYDRRLSLGLTQQAMADRAGTSQNAVTDFELGKRAVSLPMLLRLAYALELTPAALLETALDELGRPPRQVRRGRPRRHAE